jgi:hypothetical protein
MANTVKRNKGMFGGDEKDPNKQEYEKDRPEFPDINDVSDVVILESGSEIGVNTSDVVIPESCNKSGVVKIPLEWGKKYGIAYDDGSVVEYGRGKRGSPPLGAKPLYYLIEALE